MRTNIQPLFDEFKLHATDDVFRGFSGRISQLIIQGVDTPTKAAWVAEFVQELTARMRKCEHTVCLRPEAWFPKVPSLYPYNIYVVINQGVIPVDDLDQSGLAEWHALEGRQFATAAAFLALSSGRPAETAQGAAPQTPTADSAAPQSSAPPRTSVGKALCWNGRSVTCFLVPSRWDISPLGFIRRIDTSCLTKAVEIAGVLKGKIILLATIGPHSTIVHDVDNTLKKLGDTRDVIMCIADTLEPALRVQLPGHMFDLYEHTVKQGDELVNGTNDDIVVSKCTVRQLGPGIIRTCHYHMVTPGGTVCSVQWSKEQWSTEETVVCSEPVLLFAK